MHIFHSDLRLSPYVCFYSLNARAWLIKPLEKHDATPYLCYHEIRMFTRCVFSTALVNTYFRRKTEWKTTGEREKKSLLFMQTKLNFSGVRK